MLREAKVNTPWPEKRKKKNKSEIRINETVENPMLIYCDIDSENSCEKENKIRVSPNPKAAIIAVKRAPNLS
jgi:hypothetical protein